MKDNAVARAIAAVGGPTEASFLLRVSAAAIYKWRKLGFIYDARAAVKLSRASGIPVEELAGMGDKMSATYQASSPIPAAAPVTLDAA